ncbi:MAG: HAMP domain-containing protein [Dehalococcoidia bacterium]|nr:MAG: HAMP domain-containing protein [Dehalococcoidia bacterium]
MFKKSIINKLSTQLTVAFLLAAILGVALVAILTYNSTTSNLSTFIGHMGGMGMMGNVVLEAQREFINNLEQNLWLAGFLGAVLAIVLSIILTRKIVSPLSRITSAAQKVRLGDLNQRVDIGGSSELADLGNSFNNMVEKLEYDQELRHNMVADIAHELRTPLSIVQGNVEAMLDGVMPADNQNLNSLHQETLLLSRLVEDLRTLSLAESGQLKYFPQEMDLVGLIRNVVDGFKAQFATKNIRLKIADSERLPRVWADKDRTAQIIRNLLSNAFYYTPDNGSVSIKLTSNPDSMTVSINDSGTGIPPEDLQHIFDRFYRVDRSRTRKTGGSGLGLAIVKQLVEAQGGKIWVESVMGKGCSFYFNLPLV